MSPVLPTQLVQFGAVGKEGTTRTLMHVFSWTCAPAALTELRREVFLTSLVGTARSPRHSARVIPPPGGVCAFLWLHAPPPMHVN